MFLSGDGVQTRRVMGRCALICGHCIAQRTSIQRVCNYLCVFIADRIILQAAFFLVFFLGTISTISMHKIVKCSQYLSRRWVLCYHRCDHDSRKEYAFWWIRTLFVTTPVILIANKFGFLAEVRFITWRQWTKSLQIAHDIWNLWDQEAQQSSSFLF